MKRTSLLPASSLLLLMILVSGCGFSSTPIPTVAITNTIVMESSTTPIPDPCSSANIGTQIDKVHRHMREFDDASTLAANLPQVALDQLTSSIANLQRIRREAEDEPIPACLSNLKSYQIAHMNSVINTLIAFMNKSDSKIINQGIAIARQQHDQYVLELARLLGITVVPSIVAPTPAQTQSP